jgi:hypothetical protein
VEKVEKRQTNCSKRKNEKTEIPPGTLYPSLSVTALKTEFLPVGVKNNDL